MEEFFVFITTLYLSLTENMYQVHSQLKSILTEGEWRRQSQGINIQAHHEDNVYQKIDVVEWLSVGFP